MCVSVCVCLCVYVCLCVCVCLRVCVCVSYIGNVHYFDFGANPLPFLTFPPICDIFCLDCFPNNVAGLSHP